MLLVPRKPWLFLLPKPCHAKKFTPARLNSHRVSVCDSSACCSAMGHRTCCGAPCSADSGFSPVSRARVSSSEATLGSGGAPNCAPSLCSVAGLLVAKWVPPARTPSPPRERVTTARAWKRVAAVPLWYGDAALCAARSCARNQSLRRDDDVSMSRIPTHRRQRQSSVAIGLRV